MIIPIRCMTCGNMIASKWKKYQETLSTVKVTARSNLITNEVFELQRTIKLDFTKFNHNEITIEERLTLKILKCLKIRITLFFLPYKTNAFNI